MSLPKLKPLVKGRIPTLLQAEVANEIIERINAITSLTVSPSGVGKFVAGKNGMILDITGLVSSITDFEHPLQCNLSGSEITVVFGTVAGLTPTIGGQGIDSETPPVLSVNSAGTVYAKVTYDYTTSIVSKAEIIFSRTAKNNTTTEAYQPIANVLSEGGVLTVQQIVTGSLGFYTAFGQAVFVGL